MYGRRLAKYSKNISNEMIERLVNDCPAHDFVIDREESLDLFIRVLLPSTELTQLTLSLGERAFRTNGNKFDIDFLKLKSVMECKNSDQELANKVQKSGANDDGKAKAA